MKRRSLRVSPEARFHCGSRRSRKIIYPRKPEDSDLTLLKLGDQQNIKKLDPSKGFINASVTENPDKRCAEVQLFAPPSIPASEQMETTLAKIGSLHEFLERRDAQTAYFTALQTYFGAYRFPRESYDAILTQLRVMLPRLPELEKRLWEPTFYGKPFSIHASTQSYGRELDAKAFSVIFDRLLSELMSSTRATLNIGLMRERVEQVSADVRAFEKGNLEHGAKARRAYAAEFYTKLRAATPDLEVIASSMLLSYLRSQEVQSLVRSPDADIVLALFNSLRQYPSHVLQYHGFTDDTDFWPSFIREKIPTVSALLENTEVFREVTGETRRGNQVARGGIAAIEYRFRPISRGFHGLWRGIIWKECMGGDPAHLDQLMPERWAAIAVANSKFWNIERNDHCLGSLLLVPVEIKGKTYLSFNARWPLLFTPMTVHDGKQMISTTVFDTCLHELSRTLPFGERIVLGKSKLEHRFPGDIEAMETLPSIVQGEAVGTTEETDIPDPFAKNLINLSESLGYGNDYRKKYGVGMLTDATITDAGTLIGPVTAQPQT